MIKSKIIKHICVDYLMGSIKLRRKEECRKSKHKKLLFGNNY